MPDAIESIIEAAAIDQIVLRAVLREVVKRHAAKATDADAAKREIVDSLHEFIDHYSMPGANAALAEQAREKARRTIDAIVAAIE